MIARLKGTIDEIGADWLVIDVSGVGYFVHCPSRTINALPKVGSTVAIHIETHVREGQVSLYGFSDIRERECFRLLTTVQGVGAKVAIAILGSLSPDQLVDAIIAQDKVELTRAEGVGPRLAARLLTELKDRILLVSVDITDRSVKKENLALIEERGNLLGTNNDAISALVNLGYGRSESYLAVSRAVAEMSEDPSLELIIPAALKELGQ
jgi:Holliday junction DNA helicase RuvA